jgi:hypothetical protein
VKVSEGVSLDDEAQESDDKGSSDDLTIEEEQFTKSQLEVERLERMESPPTLDEDGNLLHKLLPHIDEKSLRDQDLIMKNKADILAGNEEMVAIGRHLEYTRKQICIIEKKLSVHTSNISTNSTEIGVVKNVITSVWSEIASSKKEIQQLAKRCERIESDFLKKITAIEVEGIKMKNEIDRLEVDLKEMKIKQMRETSVPGLRKERSDNHPPEGQFVRIKSAKSDKIFWIPIDESGVIDLDHVRNVFSKVNALEYEVEGVSFLIFAKEKEFHPPNSKGWGSRVYIATGPDEENSSVGQSGKLYKILNFNS